MFSIRVSDIIPKRLFSWKDASVVVTNHAVLRFLDWRRNGIVNDIDSVDAEKFLIYIVQNGKRVRSLPGGAYEIEYKGLYAVVKPEKGKLVVLTFNGDKKWQTWWKKQRRRERFRAKTLAAL